MARSAAARRRPSNARPSRRRRRSAYSALVVVGLLGALIAIGYYAFAKPSQQLQPSDLGNLEAALSQVPSQDVPAPELGLPRPAGSVRSYFHDSGKVKTVIYASHAGFDGVKTSVEAGLATAGWISAGRSGTPPVRAAQSWSSVYGRQGVVVQTSVLATSSATSTIYIVQDNS